jgi:uncharacterized protein
LRMGVIQNTIIMVILMFSLAGCGGCGGGGATTAEQGPGPQTGLPHTQVRIVNSDDAVFTIDSEVASTAVQRTTGMMYRTSLDAGKGMLFVFDSESYLSFWMKNTLIPLDMIFISADKKIVDINHAAQPGDETPFTARAPAKYVLEVNGGWCADNSVSLDDRVQFDDY